MIRTQRPPEDTFDRLYGLHVVDRGDGYVRAEVPVSNRVCQPLGLVHGGLFAAMAESMASMGTDAAVAGEGRTAVGLANQTKFLRSIRAGTVHAEARARHRGRTMWLWDVDITDDQGRLCAVTRITIAVREARDGGIGYPP